MRLRATVLLRCLRLNLQGEEYVEVDKTRAWRRTIVGNEDVKALVGEVSV